MSKVIFIPTKKEYEKLFPNLSLEYNNFYYYAKYNDITIVVTGIGKVNVSISATHYFCNHHDVEEAYLIGIAGAYRESGLNVGDVVTVENDFFVDEGLIEDNYLKMLNEIGFAICEDNKTVFKTVDGLKHVDANTVSLLSSTDQLAKLYKNKTGASIESMEGAAFGLVCAKYNINSYQIRSISNYCGNRKHQEWNIKLAFKNLKNTLCSLLSVK
ncbi:hypothetical protein FHQ18_09820 [Deferribacter autotrophicus]|uniref:Futalosine hydrolase n=1 Tax=Deferribacter autotrophicus TaxID=500465 RepID=A0A5A8F6K0_9BACT|nr:hypothetical protein [Deferribacter autotrophicus]KAA0257334.1 hypothetical protein FHQ18_09820 [Deferribacter autotrophicus]